MFLHYCSAGYRAIKNKIDFGADFDFSRNGSREYLTPWVESSVKSPFNQAEEHSEKTLNVRVSGDRNCWIAYQRFYLL